MDINTHSISNRHTLFGYNRIQLFGIICAIWILLGLLCAAQIYFKSVLANAGAVTISSALTYALPVWMIWIPATYAVIALCKRYYFGDHHHIKSFSIHSLASIGFAFLHMIFHAFWLLNLYDIPHSVDSMTAQTVNLLDDIWLQLDLLVYWGIVGAYFSLNYYEQNRQRQMQNLRMESQLSEAKLTALKAQVHPHFLFNVLSAIQTMVMKNATGKAAEMITKLSDYLRLSLDENEEQTQTLKKELDFIKHYLTIEKYRFGDRLNVVYDIDHEVIDTKIPALLLQPIVENAIQHGLAPKEGKMNLNLSAKRHHEMMEISISDNGMGKNTTNKNTLGTGLQRIRDRLLEMYGNNHLFDFFYPENGGFSVNIRIPVTKTTVRKSGHQTNTTFTFPDYDTSDNSG